MQSSSSNLDAECQKECPMECEQVNYDYQISQSNFPSPYHADNLKENPTIRSKLGENLTFENIKESVASLNIYYEDNQFTIIEETPKTSIGDLLGSIGGNLGLFIGASVLSFVEIFEIFLFLIQEIFKKNFNI